MSISKYSKQPIKINNCKKKVKNSLFNNFGMAKIKFIRTKGKS